MFEDEKMMKQFQNGETIIKEGDSGKELFIIVKGKVNIVKESDDVKTTLATLTEGDIFGEMALVDSRPRSATAEALGDVTVRVLDRESFKAMLTGNPKVAMLVFDKLCQRLRSVNDELQREMVRDANVHKALGHITLRRGMI